MDRGKPSSAAKDPGSSAKAFSFISEVLHLLDDDKRSHAEVVRDVAELAPSGWRYPQHTTARFFLHDAEQATAGYRDTAWMQRAEITMDGRVVGGVEVAYLETHPKRDDSPFLTEAQALIDILAAELGRHNDRRRNRQELHLKNIVFESSIAAGSIADTAGVITHVNQAFLKLWGYENADQAVGGSVGSFFVNPEDAGPVLEALNTDGSWAGEFLAQSQDGTQFISRGYATAIRNEKGEHIGYQSANLNVTPERQAQNQLKQTLHALERSNQDLEQFAYVASHDLQEPLRMVASYVQLLQKRYQGQLDSDADDFIAYAVDGATRMKRLINDLLTFSRVETRGEPAQSVSLDRAVRQAELNLQAAIQESGAELVVGDLPSVYGDFDQLVALFQNLIGNAVKFHDEGPPHVEITAAQREGLVEVAVRDRGIGIAPEYFDRIFTIFQRLHGKHEFGGTGIGLAICKRIVARHGGRIRIESQLGRGATFLVTLRADAPDTEHPQ